MSRNQRPDLFDFPVWSLLQSHPVVLTIFNPARALERLTENFVQIVVVRHVLKAKVADVAEVLTKLFCSLSAIFSVSHP